MVAPVIQCSGIREQGKMGLLALQSKMKQDPDSYESELLLQLRHFHACLHLFSINLPAVTASTSHDPETAKELGELATFLAHLTFFYPKHLKDFPQELLKLLDSRGRQIPSFLRRQIVQALILLCNRQVIELVKLLPVFMDLQCCGDRAVRKLIFTHVVHNISNMNRKHRNEAKNRALQNIVFPILQDDDETRAKCALVLVCDLYRRKIWVDERSANAICLASFHKSSKIMIATLRFLHGYDTRDEGDDSSDDEDDGDTNGRDGTKTATALSIDKEAIYKAYHKGTASSRRKKQAKLERAMRSMKKQQRIQSQGTDRGSFLPLQHLHDPQGFAEKLFARLNTSNERFEVKQMMMMAISRVVGMHRLLLLNFYPYLQRYIQPHQSDVTQLLATTIQACHDMVPPDAVEPILRQLVNQFVHDRARPEVIAVGLNTTREICLRMPLVMTSELLEDLALYKKSREKAVSSAAASIVALYRQVCPSMLQKRERGRGANLESRPRAYGETTILDHVPGAELLHEENLASGDINGDDEDAGSDDVTDKDIYDSDMDLDVNKNNLSMSESTDDQSIPDGMKDMNDEDASVTSDANTDTWSESDNDIEDEDEDEDEDDDEDEDKIGNTENDTYNEIGEKSLDTKEEKTGDVKPSVKRKLEEASASEKLENNGDGHREKRSRLGETKTNDVKRSETSEVPNVKRKLEKASALEKLENSGEGHKEKRSRLGESDFNNNSVGQLSLTQLRRLASTKDKDETKTETDGIFSNEDFEHIRKLQANQAANTALSGHGLGNRLNERPVNPAILEANIRRRQEKDERISTAQAGREDRIPYGARAAMKQNKKGGLSNREKEKKKGMPLAAKRAKVARSRQQKKAKGGGKNFRGKKAWK